MQSAETVLRVLRERGRRGLPCNELYRQMFNPELYLVAYGRIYSNKGAMTPGACAETVDGMSLAKIGKIVAAMRQERYRFRPVRRIFVPKKNGKRRPLGLPGWSDKLVGEVMRLLLEAYYEPQFSDHSHGFRPQRGCHTALRKVADTWKGTTWFIEGDISDCFGSLDHEVMLAVLAEKIHDNRFLRLVRNMLKAGYLEDWRWHATLSGAPQGGVLSPILSNIYLHKLDTFVENTLIPEYNKGGLRKRNTAYRKVESAYGTARRNRDRATARELRRRLHAMPSQDMYDPAYRRLRYVRYADDTLFGFAGPKHEAEQIKQRLRDFLRDNLKLELSPEKTLVTHARTGAARFLGYEIKVRRNDRHSRKGRRPANGDIMLLVPATVVKEKCKPYLKYGKPARRTDLLQADDHDIVGIYGSIYRGIVQYYLLAGNVHKLNRLHWVMQTSLLRTLANKHRSTVTKMARKHKRTIQTPAGPRKCLQASAESSDGRKLLTSTFGGIPLQRNKKATVTDRRPDRSTNPPRKELIRRLVNGRCELCDAANDIEVHHVRSLAELGRYGHAPAEWVLVMAKRRRKTLVVCQTCHSHIHNADSANTQ